VVKTLSRDEHEKSFIHTIVYTFLIVYKVYKITYPDQLSLNQRTQYTVHAES